MPDTLTPRFTTCSSDVHGNVTRTLQLENYHNAQKIVVGSTSENADHRKDTGQPRGWMQPNENFLPSDTFVLNPAQVSATAAPIRPAPELIAALPGPNDAPPLPSLTPWGAHDGTHGYVERRPLGVTFLATCGVAGSRTTVNITLQPNTARELAAVVYAAYDARLKRPNERWHQCWGNPMDVGGTVTVHAAGVNVSFVSGSDEDSIKSIVHFRHPYAAHEAFTLLFGQADAWDAEYGGAEDVA